MLISIKTREEDGSRYMMCAGTVTREVKTGATAKGTPKAEFGMKYAKGEFMNVSAVGDDDVTRMAACLEKGDAVLVCGVWKTRSYTTRDGEQKEWSELHAEFVAPQTVMAAVLELLAAESEKPRPLSAWSRKNLPVYEPQQWKDPLERRRNITDSSG